MQVPYDIPHRRLIETALGERPADLVIRDGTLVDVYSGRLLPHRSVAVTGRWIAYAGPDASHTIGDKTVVIEAQGRVIAPGYMDTHTHVDSYWNIADFIEYAAPCGLTTCITEAESYGYAFGARGVRVFLDQVRGRPVKFYCLVPPMVTLSPALKSLYITREQLRDLLQDELVMGLGESYWQGVVLTPDNRVLDLMEETLLAGKSVQGHAAGAFDRKLSAYAAAGAQSCHEAISSEDVLSRLEQGFYVMVREGDIRQDLEIILSLRDKIDLRRVILVTDGTNPDMLLKVGYLVDVIQRAVDKGLDPVRAVQMVTLNPAEHFGLDHVLGGIAPGRFADLLVLPRPGNMRPDLVISEGRIIAENGRVTVPLPRVPYPEDFYRTVRIDPLEPSQLAVAGESISSDGTLRTMDIQPGGLVTREGTAEAVIRHGQVVADPGRDLLKTVFIERLTGRGECFVGFLRGWGQKEGAIATTLCWEAGGVLGIGANDHDLALAVNRVIANQGGTSLVVHGEVLVDIPFSVMGCVSDLRVDEMSARLKVLQDKIASLGSGLRYAHLTLMVLTTAAIPFIRMTEKGYFRFRENDIVGI